MLIRELLGKKVVTVDGLDVGVIEDVQVSDDWRVQGLILRLTRVAAKEIGIRLSLRARGVVDTSLVKGIGDYVTVGVERSKLREFVKPL